MLGIGNKEISIVALNEKEAGMTGLGVITKLGAVKVGEFVDKKAEKFFTTPRKKGMVEWVPAVAVLEAEPDKMYFVALFFDESKAPMPIAHIGKVGWELLTLAIKIMNGEELTNPTDIKFREAIRVKDGEKGIFSKSK